jgi:hypothetical protein
LKNETTDAISRARHLTSSGIASAPILAVAKIISRCSTRLPTRKRDGIALAYSDGQQSVSDSIHPRIELGISDLLKAVFSGDFDREFLRIPAQPVAHQ